MSIYTRTGDKGKTSLFSGKRVWKSDARVETYGTLDELNSVIGLSISYINKKNKKSIRVVHILTDVQITLFYIGSYFADLPDTISDIELDKKIEEFEKHIDFVMSKMPKFTNFILPGGGTAGATLHVARTIARRLERLVILLHKKEKVNSRVIQYINRLSDLLFALARYQNHLEKKKETIWQR